MDSKLMVSASPHATSHGSTRMIMMAVVAALLPTMVASSFIFGPRVLLVCGVSVACCVIFEWLYCLIMKRPVPIADFSAPVTGLILAFNLPPSFPLWMTAIGAFVAIVITKQLFGGIGFNFANPALVGRIVLQLSFTGAMIDYTFPATHGGVDALASATPLIASRMGENLPLMDMLLGTHGGMLGETCALTLILGGVFLMVGKVTSRAIPLTYLGGVFALQFLINVTGANGAAMGAASAAQSAAMSLMAGGLLLGAFFMATDYTTSPFTTKGRIVYGAGLALLTVAIRTWATMPEGVSYSLLLMNLLVPYINEACRRRPLGAKKRARKGAA